MVIRSIEQDDYESLGGDLYVRGYVRAALARVRSGSMPSR